jgi:hypothetical protein
VNHVGWQAGYLAGERARGLMAAELASEQPYFLAGERARVWKKQDGWELAAVLCRPLDVRNLAGTRAGQAWWFLDGLLVTCADADRLLSSRLFVTGWLPFCVPWGTGSRMGAIALEDHEVRAISTGAGPRAVLLSLRLRARPLTRGELMAR